MCGLTGIFDSSGRRPIDAAQLARMNDRLAHRGPDGTGYHLAPGIGLGHRRLSIIDLAGGHQPMFNEDGTVAVVTNGEIYNFQALTAELTGLGHRFQTVSDTEVVVHAWEEWGADCVARLHGMFAFALWDAGQETLFLARDRLGKKPLYYALLADGLVLFGSELKALVAYPGLPLELDATAIEDYFAYGYVPDPKSIYRAVRKLEPAHTLTLRRGRPAPAPVAYWRPQFAEHRAGRPEALAEELVARLKPAVEKRLIADVPLGAFLSGGVDSGGIVALMAGLTERPVKTFSIGFEHPDFDESEHARAVALRYRTDHHERTVDPNDFALVDRLAAIYDEPFGDSSAMPTYRVSALARQRVTVALSGDGGDELFGGYRRYLWHHREERLRRLMPAALRRPLFGLLGRVYPKLDRAPRILRAKHTFQELAVDAAEGYFLSVSVLDDGLRRALYGPGLRRELQGYHAIEVLRGHLAAADTDHPLLAAQYADLKTYLAGDILTKVDRASMAHSLEVRVPLLDHEFVEWSAGLPADLKLRGGAGKYLLKRALPPYLPAELLHRPKQGFSAPIGAWFRGPLAGRLRAALAGPAMAHHFDTAFLARLVDQHTAGARDHGAVLWSLLMFESFLRNLADGPAQASAA